MKPIAVALTLTGLLASAAAFAHVAIKSGPGFAGESQEIAFDVGHGCQMLDTYSIRAEIPAGMTSVRPMTSNFGKTVVEKNAAGDVVAVTWQKSDADLTETDSQFYKLVVRVRVPNKPFTVVYMPVHQVCKGTDGGTLTSEWTAMGSASDGGETEEPAPALLILPSRVKGWNKYMVPQEITDLKLFFGDAQIIWKGNAGYSANPNTAALITTTEGVSTLTSLQANDEVWVKY
ncbi:MAG: DUF1775 domain-containing protein [Myxococcaceae bacterium]